jgi:hypothetical protein
MVVEVGLPGNAIIVMQEVPEEHDQSQKEDKFKGHGLSMSRIVRLPNGPVSGMSTKKVRENGDVFALIVGQLVRLRSLRSGSRIVHVYAFFKDRPDFLS